jgi:hypothetical protein
MIIYDHITKLILFIAVHGTAQFNIVISCYIRVTLSRHHLGGGNDFMCIYQLCYSLDLAVRSAVGQCMIGAPACEIE